MSVSLSLSLEQFHCFWYSRYFCNTRKTCTSKYFWTCRTISIRCMLHILFWIPAPAGPKIYISAVPDLVGHIKELPIFKANIIHFMSTHDRQTDICSQLITRRLFCRRSQSKCGDNPVLGSRRSWAGVFIQLLSRGIKHGPFGCRGGERGSD